MRIFKLLAVMLAAAGLTKSALAAGNPWTFDPTNVAISGGSLAGADISGTSVTANGALNARTLAALSADRLNVLSYGVDNTGATNTTSALLTAINTAASEGVAAYLPCGTYSLDGLTISASNVTVVTDGACVTFKRKPAAIYGSIMTLTGSNIYLGPAVTFDGNKANETVLAHNFWISGASNFTIPWLKSINSTGNGVNIASTNDEAANTSSIIGTEILTGNSGLGINVQGSAWYLTLLNTTASGNGTGGGAIGDIGFPYTSAYKGAISHLTIGTFRAIGNTGNGLALSGFVQAGATSYATSVPGPGNDPIFDANIGTVIAINNTLYGAVMQIDKSHVGSVYTTGNGAAGPSWTAGLLANAENTIFENVRNDETVANYGTDAGGCYYCSFNAMKITGPNMGLDLEGVQYTHVDNVHCDNFGYSNGGLCISVRRGFGGGAGIATGATDMGGWDANHVWIDHTSCTLKNIYQTCVGIYDDPQYVSVRDSRSSGSELSSVYQFDCTVGCDYANNKTDGSDPYLVSTTAAGGGTLTVPDWVDDVEISSLSSAGPITNVYTNFLASYLNAVYRATITAGGSNYGHAIITASGGGCSTEPTAVAGENPATLAVVNDFMTGTGAACTSTPTCTITDSNGSGSGATCTFSMAPWNSIIGRTLRIRNMATNYPLSFASGTRLYTPNGGTLYAPAHSVVNLTGDANGGTPAWWTQFVQYLGATPYGQSLATVSAAGTAQSTATILAATDNNVTSATSGSATGVCLPDSNLPLRVRNSSGVTISVYPCLASEKINNGAAGAPLTEATGTQQSYVLSNGNWMVSP